MQMARCLCTIYMLTKEKVLETIKALAVKKKSLHDDSPVNISTLAVTLNIVIEKVYEVLHVLEREKKVMIHFPGEQAGVSIVE